MSERTTCVVVGGGPAGMMLGLLLARARVEVSVLENAATSCATSARPDYPGLTTYGIKANHATRLTS